MIPASLRRLLRNLSIRRKLTFIVLVTSGVAVILASATFLAYDFVAFREQMVASLQATAKNIGLFAAPALWPDYAEELPKALTNISGSSEMACRMAGEPTPGLTGPIT